MNLLAGTTIKNAFERAQGEIQSAAEETFGVCCCAHKHEKTAYGACTSKRATMTKLTKCTLLSAIVQGEMASKLTKTTAKGSKTSN